MMPALCLTDFIAKQPQRLIRETSRLPVVKQRHVLRPGLRLIRALIDGMEDFSIPTDLVEEAAEVSEMTGTLPEPFPEEAGVASAVLDLPAELLEDPLLEVPDASECQEEAVQSPWYEQISKRTQSLILLNVMVLLMASNGVVVKDAEALLDPYTFSALRFFASAASFVPFLSMIEREYVNDVTIKAGLEVGCWSTLGYLFQTIGLESVDASTAGFLGGMFVVIVPVLVGLSGKGISNITWMGAVLSIIGTSLLEQGSSTSFGAGDLFCLLSATFFAIQIIRTESYTKSLSAKSSLPILAVATSTTAVISAILALATHPAQALGFLHHLSIHHSLTFTPHMVHKILFLPWADIMYTGVLSTSVVLVIEMFALEHVSAAEAAIIYTIQPVVAGALAFVVLGERWTELGWVGAALILTASLGTQILSADKSTSAGEDGSTIKID